MTLPELVARLESTGMPVAFQEFLEKDLPKLPYITYSIGDRSIFYADGVAYYAETEVSILVHSKVKNLDLESRVRSALIESISNWTESGSEAEDEYRYTITAYAAEESEE